ncbi:thiosulfate sulfurtransferase YnjE [Dorea formicigenerans]|uniref:rhodanese-like domain-containing protein n=1 Tax=Dorea formicigenerans TaxID=39486 RepID=UPI00156EBC7B|nr:rhodanese-like domain-containing protein [Dorea formicigenerans]NSE46109.1 thiosulfate sulfurtransferase YnjE [Dorea formicigenerans]
MKKKAFLLLMTMTLAMGVSACGSTEKETETKKDTKVTTGEVGTVSVDELDTSKMQVIDIRGEEQYIGWTTEEGKGGHIKDAIDFPESWLDMDIENDAAIGTTMESELERRGLDLSKETVLYSNGEVSEEDAKKYQDLGFENLSVLEGGYDAYVDSGKDTDSLKNYEMYVYPQWVQDLVDGKNPDTYEGKDYKVLEVSLASEDGEYKGGHIPGAINVNADNINHVPGLRALADYENVPMDEQLKFWNRPTDSDIQAEIESLGITKDTTVVLYGTTAATTASARAAAILKYAGVEDIRILNGGKTLWKLQERELEEGENTPEKVTFGATVPVNPDVFYDYDEELDVVNDNKSVVASIRSWEEYLGNISGYTYIGDAGDIANARFGYAGSDPYSMEDYRNVDNTMFNYTMIAERWEKWGITPDKRVSFHCGTGWRASETYFYACALGWDDVHIYDGGWYEWSKHSDSPRKDKGLPSDAPEKEPQEYFIAKEK